MDKSKLNTYTELLIQKATLEKLMVLLYNIKTSDDYLLWFKQNKNLPIYTQKRVLDCYLHIICKDIMTINDDIIELLQKIVNNFWKHQIKNKTKLVKIEDNVLKELLEEYHKKYKDNWYNIELHTDTFKSFLIKKLKSND